MKSRYYKPGLFGFALLAVAIGAFALKKCNSGNRDLPAGASDQARQPSTGSISAKHPDNQPASADLPGGADQHEYILEKVEGSRIVESGSRSRRVGRDAENTPAPVALKAAAESGWRYVTGTLRASPDGRHILLFDWRVLKWQVWAIQDGPPSNLVAEPPSEVGSSEIFTWHWLNNDRLIGQHHALFDPPIEGYANEGWTESTILYIFDLKTLSTSSVGWPSQLTTAEKQFQIDPLSDGNTLTVQLKRYYSIHSVSDRGDLHLVSLDTTQPEGGNQRDEGVFILRRR